ncbi:Ubiquitin fusion degradation protein 4 [Spathaspora sp. JA1]|nr:Ubiquitin fusion degradation protein 4 [Spathaspora sp. JA1]
MARPNRTDPDIVTSEEEEDSEYSTLVRLSQQANNRTRHDPTFNQFTPDEEDIEIEHSEVEGDSDEEEDVDEDDDDYDMIEPDAASFLQSLLQLPRRDNDRFEEVDRDEEGHDDDDMNDDDIDPRAEFLRAIGALSGRDLGGRPPPPLGGTTPAGAAAESGGETGTTAPPAGGAASGAAPGFVDVMQRLMSGGLMFDSNNTHNEIDSLISNLNQRQDTFIILESLNELSERLLMMNGITAERLIPANKLAKSLLNIMEDPIFEEELELHLVACRCLYNFLEVNQDFIHDALNNNAIRILCQQLLTIKYIDLTEQMLQTLEMISRDPISHNSIISNQGLHILEYLDFLTIHAQRKCLTIISNCCRNISWNNFNQIKSAFGNIAGVTTNHQDQIVVEQAWLTISRIIVSFNRKPEYLNELFLDKQDLLLELTQVIQLSCNNKSNSESKKKLNYSSCLSLIKSLIILTSVSIEVSKILLVECKIGKVILESLTTQQELTIESIMAAPKDLISQFLTLIGELIPVNNTDDESLPINKSRRELCLEIIPGDYWKFINDIWTFLIISFESTMDFEIRKKCINIMYRIIYSSSDLSNIPEIELISPLLSSIVNQGQGSIHSDVSDDKVNSNVLLLVVSFNIIQNIFEKSKTTSSIVQNFQRQGLIKDVNLIVADLKDVQESELPPSQELVKSKVFPKLYTVGVEIEKLYEKFFTTGTIIIPEHIKILQDIQTILNDVKLYKSYTYADWINIWNKLKYVISLENISSFELMSCGLIESLNKIFQGKDYNTCHLSFIEVFFTEESPIKSLVYKLQQALTRSESFNVVSATANNRFKSHHALANQIRLKLTCEDDQEIPNHLKSMILSVHAIATFKSVFTFLRQRFRFLEELNEKKSDEEINIEFLINGEVIPNETTIYGAIYRSLQQTPEQIIDPSKQIWNIVHNVSYRKVGFQIKEPSNPIGNLYDQDVEFEDQSTIGILQLLNIIFHMNEFVKPSVTLPHQDFTNWKLTVKLNRQLEEPLVVASGTLPGWSIYITKQFPFIFPLETRIFFLQSTSFGYSRLINQWQIRTGTDEETQSNDDSRRSNSLGRPTRHKVRISRDMMLASAVKVLNLYGSIPGILEIEYFDEVGSGLGPTLEFYSTVSKEFARKKLKLWRDETGKSDDDGESFVENRFGFFPAPLDKHQLGSENGKKILYFFSILGKFIARALLDSRIIDFQFNPVFLKLIQLLNQTSTKLSSKSVKKFTSLNNLKLVDRELADSIEHLQKFTTADPTVVKDLCLHFVLPGNPEYELTPNGNDIPITSENLQTYLNKIIETTLYSGIIHQTKAFMDGFSTVFPINSLIIFQPSELAELFGNSPEDWSSETISSSVNANHGYTKDSPTIKALINILINLTPIEKRQFLQFLTGAPKLPIGGFKCLNPNLTVVRKHAEDGLTDDDYLPSVMTCANYLKLPNYSSEEVMKKKLIQAINEGAEAFLLS